MTYTHMPKYIYIYICVIITEQLVITNLNGRTSVRTLHVDCSQCQFAGLRRGPRARRP